MINPVKTLVVDNFQGSMTQYLNGDINSGLTNIVESFAYDPFTQPGSLTWSETPVQIDPDGLVITDLIVAGKVRVESGILYTYAIGHTGRLYKIQVNSPSTFNPDYDNPVLLATLTANAPTFTRGGFMDFYGATEKIYIGHDKGVTTINFDGTGEAFVGDSGQWVQNVPRPFVQFLGILNIGNGSNTAQIDTTETVVTYGKFSPSFPLNTQVRDLDVTPDGNYLQATVAELPLSDITLTTPDTSILSTANSYVFKWNGTDTSYTSFITYPSVTLSASAMFGNYEYGFGYDFRGGGVYNPINKFLTSSVTSAYGESPSPNAVISMSNVITWITTLPFDGHLELTYCIFGTISEYEIERGYWAPLGLSATGSQTDIQRIPCQILVSNFAQGASSNGYVNNIFGKAKVYFSTLETSNTPTTAYKFYSWSPVPTGLGVAFEEAVYQTQTQIFSKKVQIKEVRVYGEPWVDGNSFTIDLIDSSGNPITNGSATFLAGDNLTIGDDFAWYNPTSAPTYAFGLRITNKGEVNHVINKIEIDYDEGGK